MKIVSISKLQSASKNRLPGYFEEVMKISKKIDSNTVSMTDEQFDYIANKYSLSNKSGKTIEEAKPTLKKSSEEFFNDNIKQKAKIQESGYFSKKN